MLEKPLPLGSGGNSGAVLVLVEELEELDELLLDVVGAGSLDVVGAGSLDVVGAGSILVVGAGVEDEELELLVSEELASLLELLEELELAALLELLELLEVWLELDELGAALLEEGTADDDGVGI